ncbi:lamin tail domain-containing protein [Saccharicrinis aurantiacus]|uniref:lamin tail domain-containing protein n=1 Tax=Saccharicrinis aurantiacus TaxID=1849719 RepID=UPI00094F58FD|nr:lamin tail domain-containing protein [Saccharicrinis aurantiacus]
MFLKYLIFITLILATIACSSNDDTDEEPVYDPPLTKELLISEVRVTSIPEDDGFRNTFVEVYNGTGFDVDLSDYGMWYSSNGSNGRWDESTQISFSGTLVHGEVIVIVREGTDSKIFPFPDFVWENLTANGDDGIALIKKTGNRYNVIDQYGEPYTNDNAPEYGAWDIAGIEDGSKDYVLWRKWLVDSPNIDWKQSAGTTEIGSEWIVISKDDYSNVGTYSPNIADFEPEDSTIPEIIPPLTNDLIISEVRVTSTAEEGDFRNTYIEIYNGTESDVQLSNYALQYASNGNDGMFDGSTQLTFDGTLAHGEVVIIAREGTDPSIILNPDYVWPDLKANGDDAVGLFKKNNGLFELIDQYGEPYDETNDPDGDWDIAGEPGASKNKVLWRKWIVSDPNTDWLNSAGTNVEDSEWIVKEKDDYSNLGTFTPQEYE